MTYQVTEEQIDEAMGLLRDKGYGQVRDFFNHLRERYHTEEPSITKFYKNQPVLVSNDGETWMSMLLVDIGDGKYLCKGSTASKGTVGFGLCKPDTNAPSILNWVEHDGGLRHPNMEVVLVEMRDGSIDVMPTSSARWGFQGIPSDILRYAQIDGPEFF